MSQSAEATLARFDQLWFTDEFTRRLPLDGTRYALFSDLHLGDGGRADNFVHNEDAFLLALRYYSDQGFRVILVGDIEELWQFDLAEIRQRYDHTVYQALRGLASGPVQRVYGNHDREWAGLIDPLTNCAEPYPRAPEAVKLGDRIMITHGHQGEFFSDKSAWIGQFAVHVFRYVEPLARWLGWEDRSATKSQVPKDRERIYYRWATQRRVLLICGHTHRAIFASRSYATWLKEQLERVTPRTPVRQVIYWRSELQRERKRGRDVEPLARHRDPIPCYFNCGCGGYREGLTNIELDADEIRLVKWSNDRLLAPEERRTELQKGKIQEYMQHI